MKSAVNEYIIGIDEAGRGPLAGPVAIGTSFISKNFQKEVFAILKKAGLNDSKKVKEQTREELYQILLELKKQNKINWEVALVSADIISKKGIVYAINLGIDKNLKKLLVRRLQETLLARHPNEGSLVSSFPRRRESSGFIPGSLIKSGMTTPKSVYTLELDGALKIPKGNWKKATVIIKGDTIKPSIMIASIVAKVTRDRYMKKIAKKYPEYNFEIHKGYGTKKHKELIKKHGLSKEHRAGWCNT